MCFTIDEPSRRADLPLVENVLLWSMRAWAIELRSRTPVEERISEVLAGIGAADAAGQIYSFMWIIGCGALRTLEVDCVCNPGVSGNECRLLAALALTQRSRASEALVLLRTLVTADAADAALDSAMRVARSFHGSRAVPLPALDACLHPRRSVGVESRPGPHADDRPLSILYEPSSP